MIRRTANAILSLKTALNIASPSRAFIDVARAAERRPCAASVPLPWYAARGPLEPYETPKLAAAMKRIRADLYSGRTTIRSMSFEDRMLAQQHGVITGRDVSFAFWDGSFPPPAAIRCHGSKREQLGPNTESVAGCMLLAGHDGECEFV